MGSLDAICKEKEAQLEILLNLKSYKSPII